jgi:dTDP-glucose 4,6-dehydratase
MNMIGERQDKEKMVPMTIGKVLRGEEVTVHGTEGDIGTRHYLHARNLADGVLYLLRNEEPAPFRAHAQGVWQRWFSADRPDRYNIATPDRIDNLTLAQMIADYAGKQDIGWSAPVSFEESLEHTVAWSKLHPEWLA